MQMRMICKKYRYWVLRLARKLSALPCHHNEHAREGQQHGAVRHRAIGFRDGGLIAREESPTLRLVERVEKRAQRAALEPFDHTDRAARDHMEVDCAPQVD